VIDSTFSFFVQNNECSASINISVKVYHFSEKKSRFPIPKSRFQTFRNFDC
jgi:hypothetical protein